MPFKVKRQVMLKVCTDQVEALITMPRYRNTEWTDETLLAALVDLGLDYTLQEVQIMNDELHRRDILEDV